MFAKNLLLSLFWFFTHHANWVNKFRTVLCPRLRLLPRLNNGQSTCAPASRRCRCNADLVAQSSNSSCALVIYPRHEDAIQIWRPNTSLLNPKKNQTTSVATLGTSTQKNHYCWPKRCYHWYWKIEQTNNTQNPTTKELQNLRHQRKTTCS